MLFPLIVANTDDFGRMAGDAFTVKNVVLPSSQRPERDFERALDVLVTCKLVDRYLVDDRIYLQVVNFDEHQPNLHKRTTSRIPESPGTSGNYRPNLTEFNVSESKGIQENPRKEQRVCASLFDAFWIAYPKKKAKHDAQRAWDKRRPNDELLAVILRALERQKQSPDWQKESGRYIPLPATWLNGARWTDELETTEAVGLSAVGQSNAVAMERAAERYGTHD